ncbi:hypothetical protein AABB24_014418 [Solanum stoloniferum]|uniref:K Homology domain-containing protein n=1 Tax=Solanum stoloniferum TaxID=62892 RepID=A0ABD2U1K1_9SOLN
MVYSTVTDSSFPPAIQGSSAVAPPPPESFAVKSGVTGSVATEMVAVRPEAAGESVAIVQKWPGWPGDNVFRLVVPLAKVGGIIGRRGELVKRMCEETGASIRVLEGPLGNADRIVLISGRENPDAEVSPAMDAALRIFKRVAGLNNDDPGAGATGAAFCFSRLLVASSQANHLIGRRGTTIKSIQERSGAALRVLSADDVAPYATEDERIIEIHGEGLKVLDAFEAVVRLLRKFLVDHSMIPVIEKMYNVNISQDRLVESWADKPQSSKFQPSGPAPASHAAAVSGYSFSMSRDPYLLDCETAMDSELPRSTLPRYGQDPRLGGIHTSVAGRAGPIVTQITKVMQVPLGYAEDIIGVGGGNIAYIRRTSRAALTVQESRVPEEITIEIKGTSSEVQAAEQLIQEFINNHKEPAPRMYGTREPEFGSFSRYGNPYSSSSSFPSQSFEGYGSSSLGAGYNRYRY